jgi:hypothetical protein
MWNPDNLISQRLRVEWWLPEAGDSRAEWLEEWKRLVMKYSVTVRQEE